MLPSIIILVLALTVLIIIQVKISSGDNATFLLTLGIILVSFALGNINSIKEPSTKTMTINYEFKDSVYVPIDTVINNN